MNFHDLILARLARPDYQPVNEARLAREIGVDRKQRGNFRHALRSLLSRGDAQIIAGDRIAPPARAGSSGRSGRTGGGDADVLVGRIQFRAGGSAIFFPRAVPGPDGQPPARSTIEPVQIGYDDTGTALPGDTVEVRLNRPRPARAARPRQQRGQQSAKDAARENELRGRVVNIVERGSATMIGTLRRVRSSYYVQPDDPRFQHEVAVPDPIKTPAFAAVAPVAAGASSQAAGKKNAKAKAAATPAKNARPIFKPVPRGAAPGAAPFSANPANPTNPELQTLNSKPAANAAAIVPEVGDKVVVRLREWTNRHAILEGEIIERLGKTFEPGAEFTAILRKYNLEPAFPDAVQREVAGLPDKVRSADITGRLDYRDIPTFTIDPDDAKDFDDALSIEHLDGGRTRIGIHIADVSHYVKPGTALDNEARKRGNSTYLVGAVIPMLPEKLSNGLCSLVEAQDRLVKTVQLTFDAKRRLVDTAFASAVIRSRKRLTYRQAYALLFEKDLAAVRALPLPPKHQTGSTGRALSSLKDAELRDLQTWIRQLWDIASHLRRSRMRNGSLDLDMPETKVFVDEQGYADRLEKIENDESHQLIEEFMLAANEAVARLTRGKRLASLYRVHDDPDAEKLGEFRDTIATAGIKAGDLTKRSELSKVITALDQHPQGHLLRTQLLRSLKKACYRSTPDGHFGLAKKDYTHFTSPIRRYSDLVVHRVLENFLDQPGNPAGKTAAASTGKKFRYSASQMAEIGEHLSLTETNSQEAERESVKVKLVEFFERELHKRTPTRFAAIITEVRPHGLFIELAESMTFGFIPASELSAGGDDYYQPTPDGSALAGKRSKRRFALGDKIDVHVAKVDRFKRLIDFKPAPA
ncbi:3'-5' exoribonuclease [Opitutaceae bacterium TAV5]|nr:3'-5' exoribonuclease [Opitutaceae bacterium TAV5]